MGSTPAHAPEMAPPRRNDPGEDARGRAEEADGLRKAGEAGIWLGAINPYALGLFGAAVGACVLALLARRPWRRGGREAPGG